MNRLTPAQIEMLLGGYATGTLTTEENDALMRAALENQALFDALMDEEALRETLSDAATRDELLRALRPAEVKAKWWQTPWPWAAVATALVALAVLVMVRQETPQQTAKLDANTQPQQIAQSKPEPIPSEIAVPKKLQSLDAAPAAAPAPAPEPARNAPPAQFSQPMPATPPPPPPPIVQERAAAPAPPAVAESARRDQSAQAMDLAKESKQKAADKLTEVAATAKKGEAVTVAASADMISLEAQPDPLTVVVAFQQQDGTWRNLTPGNAAPAGRPLRLTVNSTQRGMLSTDPPVAAAQSVEPNRPAILLIAARAAGDLSFRLSLNPAAMATAPGAANLLSTGPQRQNAPRAEARAKTRAAETDAAIATGRVGGVAAGGARPTPPLATREIRLKIE
jgi:hypothetical protein